jgi:hypothetical protein
LFPIDFGSSSKQAGQTQYIKIKKPGKPGKKLIHQNNHPKILKNYKI